MTRQWDKRTAATVVVLATVALSFASLRTLAEMCGFTGWLGWVWPICLDAVAYLATRVWLEKGAGYRFARALAIGAISLSLVANGLVHGLTEYGLTPHWTIVVLVGAVPPLMLALVVHLLVIDQPASLATEPADDDEDERHSVPVTDAEQDEPAPRQDDASVDTTAGEDSLTARARELLAAARAEGDVMGRTRLARELGITEHRARRVMAEAKRPHLHSVHAELAEEAVNG